MEAKKKDFWRSLDELSDTPQFRDFLHREFPKGANDMAAAENGWSRRSFLTLMGASMALAGLASCRRPVEKIVPHVTLPEVYTPGVPIHYATSMPFGQSSFGLLVKSVDGRPIKIEGNAEHPSSLGASNSQLQATILELYDPDRSQQINNNGAPSGWAEFVEYWKTLEPTLKGSNGQGLAILSGSFSSPTLARLRQQILSKYPRATWVAYDAVNDENMYEGIRRALGSVAQPVYDLSKAKVVLSIDSDFVHYESESMVNSRGFVQGRKVSTQQDTMNRLYVVESAYSLTGGMADHRIRLKPSQISNFVLALAHTLTQKGLALASMSAGGATNDHDTAFLNAVADELMANRGAGIVLAGSNLSPEAHTVVLAINSALGNVGQTVVYREKRDSLVSSTADLKSLVAGMNSGAVSTLFMIGTNPVYNAPADLEFATALKKVKNSIHLGHYHDESGMASFWHINQAHFLESWGDTRAVDGTIAPIQPLIAPLFSGVSDIELLGFIANGEPVKGYDVVRDCWKQSSKALDFETHWRHALHDGVVRDTQLPVVSLSVNAASVAQAASSLANASNSGDLEAIFLPSNLWDGRFANLGWLQELPDPTTKVTWDNPALLSFATAARLGVNNGDVVRLELDGRTLEIAAFVSPGQADDTVVLQLGYGREDLGKVANGVGFNTYAVRTSAHQTIAPSAKISNTGKTYMIAQTQEHGTMGGFELGDPDQESKKRPILREATLAEFQHASEAELNEDHLLHPVTPEHPPLIPLWDEHKYDKGYQWGMSIDLNACVGCGSCIVACQSENNIPVVGKKQVNNGREMHWIRVDRYYAGTVHEPEMAVMPVPCMQCENAPCESVCPVAATVHDEQGLNAMVYNRCIGTRYCSNNCPYKVRRFNFFNYTKDYTEIEKMQHNPAVTLRFRGVMEKCTYCVQRIDAAKIASKLAGRTVEDGEIKVACEQSCPTGAIVFGNINDPNSRVSKQKKINRDYGLLSEMNTRPRTTYLGRLRNPNPTLEQKS